MTYQENPKAIRDDMPKPSVHSYDDPNYRIIRTQGSEVEYRPIEEVERSVLELQAAMDKARDAGLLIENDGSRTSAAQRPGYHKTPYGKWLGTAEAHKDRRDKHIKYMKNRREDGID